MLGILGSILEAALIFVICVSVASFIVTPMIKYVLINTFWSLSDSDGVARVVRRSIGYPVVALLSRQRKARRGDFEAAGELFLIDIGVGAILSIWAQGLGITLLTLGALSALFVVGCLMADD